MEFARDSETPGARAGYCAYGKSDGCRCNISTDLGDILGLRVVGYTKVIEVDNPFCCFFEW